MSYRNLKSYPLIKKELDAYVSVLEYQGYSKEAIEEFALSWMSNKDFTIIGLYAKPPKYLKGVKKYSEYFLQINPKGEYYNLAVRKEFTDITAPLFLSLPTVGGDAQTDSVFIPGDLTEYIEVGDTHAILHSSTYSPIHQCSVVSFSFNSRNNLTVVNYDSSIEDMSSGAVIVYFEKGKLLTGLHVDIKWYDNNGDVTKEKRVTRTLSKHASSNYEYSRRQRTINQMISAAAGTAVQPFVKAIYERYHAKGVISNYINFGDSESFKAALDNETDPTILSYLSIVLPYEDIEGNVITQTIKDAIKNDLYDGYR